MTADHVLELAAGGRELSSCTARGPQISAEMERRGLDVRFVGGRRVTTPAGLDVVRESLAAVNAALCRRDRPAGARPDGRRDRPARAGRCRRSGSSATRRRRARRRARRARRGRNSRSWPRSPRGRSTSTPTRPPRRSPSGSGADRILFLSDVPGLLLDGAVAASVGADEADRLLGDGRARGRHRAEARGRRARRPARRAGAHRRDGGARVTRDHRKRPCSRPTRAPT